MGLRWKGSCSTATIRRHVDGSVGNHDLIGNETTLEHGSTLGRILCLWNEKVHAGTIMAAVINAAAEIVLKDLILKANVVVARNGCTRHHHAGHVIQTATRAMRGSVRILVLDEFVELFARVAHAFASLSLDFRADHEATNVGLAADQEIVGVGSFGVARSDANKVVNVQSKE